MTSRAAASSRRPTCRSPAATVLTAAPDAPGMPAARPRVQFPFAFTSAPAADDDPGPVDPRRLVAPLPLSDGDPATVWLSRGARGETLTARAASAGHQVTGLRLLPGDSRSRARFLATARPRVLHLELGPAPDQRFEVRLDRHGARRVPTATGGRCGWPCPGPCPVRVSA